MPLCRFAARVQAASVLGSCVKQTAVCCSSSSLAVYGFSGLQSCETAVGQAAFLLCCSGTFYGRLCRFTA